MPTRYSYDPYSSQYAYGSPQSNGYTGARTDASTRNANVEASRRKATGAGSAAFGDAAEQWQSVLTGYMRPPVREGGPSPSFAPPVGASPWAFGREGGPVRLSPPVPYTGGGVPSREGGPVEMGVGPVGMGTVQPYTGGGIPSRGGGPTRDDYYRPGLPPPGYAPPVATGVGIPPREGGPVGPGLQPSGYVPPPRGTADGVGLLPSNYGIPSREGGPTLETMRPGLPPPGFAPPVPVGMGVPPREGGPTMTAQPGGFVIPPREGGPSRVPIASGFTPPPRTAADVDQGVARVAQMFFGGDMLAARRKLAQMGIL